MKFNLIILSITCLISGILGFESEVELKSRTHAHLRNRFRMKSRNKFRSRMRLSHGHHNSKSNSLMSYMSAFANNGQYSFLDPVLVASTPSIQVQANVPTQQATTPTGATQNIAVAQSTIQAANVQPVDEVNGNSTSINSTKVKPSKPYPKDYPRNVKDELLGDIEDFLMISSNSFRDHTKFPPLRMPDGEFHSIKLNEYDFRYNDAYNGAPNKKHKDIGPSKMYFYFHLVQNHIYYSTTKSDMNVLGEINIKSISTVGSNLHQIYEGKDLLLYCINIQDSDTTKYKLCHENEDTKNKWECKIKLELNITAPDNCFNEPEQNDEEQPINKRYINQPIVLVPTPSKFCNAGWNYKNHGADWECDCKEGVEQSPINLPIKKKSIESPVKPLFQYEEVQPVTKISTIDGQLKERERLKFKLVDNTFKIIHENFGKVVTLDKAVYRAQEIVIHVPAEHMINGKKYDLEVQIVHYGVSKGDIGNQMVLCFLFEKKAGIYNKFLDDLDIFNLPSIMNPEVDIRANLFIPKIFYETDDDRLPIMQSFSFYTYQGSLTAPPCTQNTIIYVASDPLFIGTTALNLFNEALRVPDMMDRFGNIIVSDFMPESNRSVQPLNGRPVFHYDHTKFCMPQPKLPNVAKIGHYEKYNKVLTKYFYVNSKDPSGVPNAYVVSEKEAKGIQ